MKMPFPFLEPWQNELIKRMPVSPWLRKNEAVWHWTGARKRHTSVKKLRYQKG